MTFHVLPLDKISFFFPYHKYNPCKWYLAVLNTRFFWDEMPCGVNSDSTKKKHTGPLNPWQQPSSQNPPARRGFYPFQSKTHAAETTADLTVFGISISHIDVFPSVIFIPEFLCKSHLADGISYC